MSQSQTSWTRLFHSPVGFTQDVPHSDLLSSWLLARERHLSLTRRTQTKDGCEGLQKHLIPATYPAIHAKQQFLQLTRKKILKTYQKRSIITLYALRIMRGNNSLTL